MKKTIITLLTLATLTACSSNKMNNAKINSVNKNNTSCISKSPLTTQGDQFLIGGWEYSSYNPYGGLSEYIQFYANHTFTSKKEQAAAAEAEIEYQAKGRWKRVGNTIYMTITKIIKYKYKPAAGEKHHPPKERLLGTYTLRIGNINTLHSDQGYALKNQDRKF